MFYISVFRLSLSQYKYMSNSDRMIQLYDGRNLANLLTCYIEINYTITVTYNVSVSNYLGLSKLPFSTSNCPNLKYSSYSRTCICNAGYGMSLCDVKFNQITALNMDQSGYLHKN